MINRIFLFFLLCLLSASISAQDQIFQFPELEGFKKVQNYPVYKPENLWDFINGAADNYLSYGFVDLNVAEYKKGKDVIKAEVYRHKDNVNAFGIYSSERSPTFNYLDLGSQGYSTGGVYNFFKGVYYVKIKTYSGKEKVIQAAGSLARRMSDMLEGSTSMPKALALFPPAGRKLNEDSYINESVLGHKFLDRAFKAVYESGSDVFFVYLLQRDDADDAESIVNKYLAAAGKESLAGTSDKYVLKDGYNGTIFLALRDKNIVIISGLAADQAAQADRITAEILK